MSLETLAMVSGAISSYAYLPELRKILKSKTAQDISLISFGWWSVSSAIWLLYGLSSQNFALILNYAIGLAGCLSIFLISLYYDWRQAKTAAAATLVAAAMILSPATWARNQTVTIKVGETVRIDGVVISCNEPGREFRVGDRRYRCAR